MLATGSLQQNDSSGQKHVAAGIAKATYERTVSVK